MKKKPVTNKVFDNQNIDSISIDVQGGVVSAGIVFFKETSMPADPPKHPEPYTEISNRHVVNKQIKVSDIQPELDALIDKIDTLV
jgi:hypothetical protein